MKQFENLEVFYTNEIQVDLVENLGKHFIDNDLVHPNKVHSIRLTSNPNSFVLNLILNPKLEEIPEDKLKEIIYLERALDTTVFNNYNFAIEITDSYFYPLISQ